MKKWMIIAAAWMLSFSLYAMQQITVNPVSFFQTPTQGVEFDYADVYVTQDVEYAQKNQTYQNYQAASGGIRKVPSRRHAPRYRRGYRAIYYRETRYQEHEPNGCYG